MCINHARAVLTGYKPVLTFTAVHVAMKMTTRAQARQVVQRVDPGLASGAADVRGVAVAALGSLQGRGEASGGRVADETYQDGTSLFEDHDAWPWFAGVLGPRPS